METWVGKMLIYLTVPIWKQSYNFKLYIIIQNYKPALMLPDHSLILRDLSTGNMITQVSSLCNVIKEIVECL